MTDMISEAASLVKANRSINKAAAASGIPAVPASFVLAACDHPLGFIDER